MSGAERSTATLPPAILKRAKRLGFSALGVVDLMSHDPQNEAWLREFVAAGYHGTMAWMEETLERRVHPKALWSERALPLFWDIITAQSVTRWKACRKKT